MPLSHSQPLDRTQNHPDMGYPGMQVSCILVMACFSLLTQELLDESLMIPTSTFPGVSS